MSTSTASPLVPCQLMHLHRVPTQIRRRRNRSEFFLCPKGCGKKFCGEKRLANHVTTCQGEEPRTNRRCWCGAKCPPDTRACFRHTFKTPEFAVLDALIEMGYGDRRQYRIGKSVMAEAWAKGVEMTEKARLEWIKAVSKARTL